MDKNYLLNDSKVFCMAPWVHLHSGIRGDVRPCCIANCETPIGDVKDNTYQEIFNSPVMKELRVDMLNGVENNICRRCNIAEQNNARNGYKTYFNNWWDHKFYQVESTLEDGTVPNFELPNIDFRFSNKCNLKCVTCGVHASSAWASDHNKLNDDNIIAILKPDVEMDTIYSQLEEIIPTVEKVDFAGGEPLMMDEHYYIIDRLVENKRFDVELHYNTNFTKLKYRGRSIFETWGKFDKVQLDISMDMIGEKGEYIRKGINAQEIIDNILDLRKNYPNIKYKITATFNVLNALDIADFHKHLVVNGICDLNRFSLIMLNDPYYLNVKILPKHHKDTVRANLNAHLGWLDEMGAWDHTKNLFQTALNYLDGELKPKHATEFKHYITRLDGLRNQSFVKTFPEIKDMI